MCFVFLITGGGNLAEMEEYRKKVEGITKGEVRRALEELVSKVLENKDLVSKLLQEKVPMDEEEVEFWNLRNEWMKRRHLVDLYIRRELGKNCKEFDPPDLYMRFDTEIPTALFTKLQNTLEVDFGICEYFEPRIFRGDEEEPFMRKSFLRDMNKCTYYGKEEDTLCMGLREGCSVRSSFRKKKYVPIEEEKIERLAKKFATSFLEKLKGKSGGESK